MSRSVSIRISQCPNCGSEVDLQGARCAFCGASIHATHAIPEKPGGRLERRKIAKPDKSIGEKIFGFALICGFYLFYFSGDFLPHVHGPLRIALLCVYFAIVLIIIWADFDWAP